MAHKHNVYDKDTHFQIDPITREITNESSKKVVLIQRDHNSERFTFVVPRQIEGHDMMKCNLVSVQYLNIDATDKSLQSKGVYEVDDLVENADETITFSWLISENATMYVGTLNFCIRFECTTGSVVDYRWQTGINSKIAISSSYDNNKVVTEAFPDILAQWKAEIFESGGDAVVNVNVAKEEAIKEIQDASESVINSAKIAEQNAKNVLANAIKGHLKGEVVRADDVSPVEHEIKARLYGKNQFNMSLFEATTDSGHAHISAVSDSSITVTTPDGYEGSGNCGLLLTLKELCTSLKAGRMYVLSGESPSSNKCIYLRDTNVYWNFGTAKTLSEDDINSKIAVYGFSARHGDGVGDCIISNIQIEEGETVTEYTPYIDPTTVNVRRCGKNLFDVSNYKTLNGNLDVNEQDGNSHTVQGAVGSSTNSYSSGAFTIKLPSVIPIKEVLTVSLYVTLQEQGAWSNAFRMWCVDRAEDFVDYRTFELEAGKRTKITASFTVENADSLARLTFYVNNNKLLIELDTLQIEKSNDVTDFEQYKGTEHTPSSDGTVSGMMSTSPNMTILTDTEGTIVECEYSKDTNKVVQKICEALGIEV